MTKPDGDSPHTAWYQLHSKQRHEDIALDHLEKQSNRCYLPLMEAGKLW